MNRFLKEDSSQVKLEQDCISMLMKKIDLYRKKGEFTKAKVATADLAKSLHELDKLQDKKKARGRKIIIEAYQLG